MSISRRTRLLLLAGALTSALTVAGCLLAGTYGAYLGLGRALDRADWLTLVTGHAWLSGADCQVGSSGYGTVSVPAIALWDNPAPSGGTTMGSLAHGSAVEVLDRRYVAERRASFYFVTDGDSSG